MMSLQPLKNRFHAKSYEQAAAQFAAEIGAKHWHNSTSGDISQWQIGDKYYTLVALEDQGITTSKGLPTINLPIWFTVTAN